MEYFLGKSKVYFSGTRYSALGANTLTNIQKFRGFMPLFAEQSTGSGLDDDPADQSTTGALSEAFDIGYEILADPERPVDDVLPPDTYGLYGDNQWPSDEVLPGFRETYLQYFREALTLCRKLFRCFALALNLEENYFDAITKYPGVTSRMLHYPSQPVQGGVIEGLGAHTVNSQAAIPYIDSSSPFGLT